MLTPARRRGFEHLDDPETDPAIRERSLRDVRVSNALLGGTRAVLAELKRVMWWVGLEGTMLDVGTGLADIPMRARHIAKHDEVRLTVFGVDRAESLARTTARLLDGSVCADARALPFETSSIDVVVCSQLLHHFEEHDIDDVLRELNRVARRGVIVSDLRRSWIAAGGFWLASWPLGFHRITRHDGTTSVLRGFTAAELAEHVHRATGERADVRHRLGYRLTATWQPSP